VIVGFPGETEEHFLETYHFLNELDISYLHVFTYSERPGTPAAEAPDQVPMHVRHERAHFLRELATRKNLEFRRRMIGKKLSVVTLVEPRAALSDNYLKVELASFRRSNELIEIEIGGLHETGLREAAPVCALTVLSSAAW